MGFPGWASPIAQSVKSLSAMQETWIRSLGREDLLEKEMKSSPVFLPGESHGQKSLAGYTTVRRVAQSRTRLKWLSTHVCIGTDLDLDNCQSFLVCNYYFDIASLFWQVEQAFDKSVMKKNIGIWGFGQNWSFRHCSWTVKK